MPITRDYTPKDVMVILDYPLLKEEQRQSAYSEASSMTMKNSLQKASLSENKKFPQVSVLSSLTVCYTYLSNVRPLDLDKDWSLSICKEKNIPEGETYMQVPWLKDVWVSPAVWGNILTLRKQITRVNPKLIVIGGKFSFLFFAAYFHTKDSPLTTLANTQNGVKKTVVDTAVADTKTTKDTKMFGALAKFRASLLTLNETHNLGTPFVIPILTPSYHFLNKDKTYIFERDYRRVANIHRMIQADGLTLEGILTTQRTALVYTAKEPILAWLDKLLAKLDLGFVDVVADIECRMRYKDCIGLAYSETESLTIPITEMYEHVSTGSSKDLAYVVNKKDKTKELLPVPVGTKIIKYRSVFSLEDEIEIQVKLNKVLLHKNCRHIGQNYNFDCQFYFHHWKLKIQAYGDTMIQHHVINNVLQKNLAMLASLYCRDYVYWKDDLDIQDNLTRWVYNGKDCMYTLTVYNLLRRLLARMPESLQRFYEFQQWEVSPAVVTMMNKGVKTNEAEKDRLQAKFLILMEEALAKMQFIIGEEFNPKSNPQIKRLMKDLLGIKPIFDRKTKAESFGSAAMLVYLQQYPEWRTFLQLFREYKSIAVFVRTFLSAIVSPDGYMRCDYGIAGTKTYRFNSRKNIFGEGLNLANIPSKGKVDLTVVAQEYNYYGSEDEGGRDSGSEAIEVETSLEAIINERFTNDLGTDLVPLVSDIKLALPNCKTIFIPDSPAYGFWDADYASADLHFVAWESNCAFLKDCLRKRIDVYSMLATKYYGREIAKDDPERQQFKQVCHATNYFGQPPTIAVQSGLTISGVIAVQEFYFSLCPEILEWHRRLETQARNLGYIENIFGARHHIYDFTEKTWINKLVAWQPQSSVAILVNKGFVAMTKAEDDTRISPRLQTHDSLSGIFLLEDADAPKRIVQHMEITIPYKDPLVIPADVKISTTSYGDCAKISKDSIYNWRKAA